MNPSDTASVARSYFEAWTNRKGPDALVPLLSPAFTFESGPIRIEGRDAFLAAGGWPERATTTMLVDAYNGEHGLQLYAAENGDKQVRIVEHLVVADGVITSSEIVVDGPSFAAFMQG
jgi:hypothetical protein